MAARRNDRLAALVEDEIVEVVGIVGAIGKNLTGVKALDQIAGRGHVILLAGTEFEPDRQPKGIDYSVDLGSEAAA